jgi:hypothetical protein
MHRRIASESVRALGFRSKLEVIVNEQLLKSGVPFAYEGLLNTIRYIVPTSKHRYLGDFLLGNGIMIEAKGLFTSQDRKKHLLIKEQHPQLDIRFLFMNSKNKLSKRSKTTYSMWSDKNGFKWCHKVIPSEWLTEKKVKEELQNIINTLKGFTTNEWNQK